jgi:hypothetical protein
MPKISPSQPEKRACLMEDRVIVVMQALVELTVSHEDSHEHFAHHHPYSVRNPQGEYSGACSEQHFSCGGCEQHVIARVHFGLLGLVSLAFLVASGLLEEEIQKMHHALSQPTFCPKTGL